MTDNNNNYFDEEKQKSALEWLEREWKNKQCECCGQNTWTIAEFLVASPRFEGSIAIGGKLSPHVQATCTTCGNTKFFNAVVMQLLKEGNAH